MWFRNLHAYRLTHGIKLDIESFGAQLAKRPLQPCGPLDMISRGWVFPRPEGIYVHSVNGQWLIALGVERKLLPGAVIRREAQKRAADIEADQERKVGRKEMRDIVERVAEELMPKALARLDITWAWVNTASGLLVIDTASTGRADELIETLLRSVDELALRPLQTRVSPVAAMTAWLASGEAPAGVTLDSDCELRAAAAAASTIRYTHHDIGGPEIANHLAAGKVATKVGMTWNDRVSFVLTDKLRIKRLAFLDMLKQEAAEMTGNADELFDADFALMAGELTEMLGNLVQALGGESA
jgi:recombination associated protein RdgC